MFERPTRATAVRTCLLTEKPRRVTPPIGSVGCPPGLRWPTAAGESLL